MERQSVPMTYQWKYVGKMAVDFLTRLLNRILDTDKMPGEWGKSVLVPIYKNGDVQICTNYRRIKIWERVVEARLWEEVEICKQQYSFIP